MSREELLDMATLDALGLLDPDDLRHFETCLRRVNVALQAEVREHQLQVGTDLSELLPDADPEAELRGRVLASVGECIELEPAPTLKSRVIGAIERSVRSDLAGSMDHALPGQFARRHDLLEQFIAGRVSPVWRFAALLFLSASVLLGGFAYHVHREAMHMANTALAGDLSDALQKRFGGSLPMDYWFHPEAQVHTFAAIDPAFSGRAMVAFLPTRDSGLLTAHSLPANDRPYELRVGPEGEGAEVAVRMASFFSEGSPIGVTFDLEGRDVSGSQWWIVGPTAAGRPVALLHTMP